MFDIRVPRNDPDLPVLTSRVENPHEQVPLTFRFFLERADGTPLLDRDGLDIPVMVLDDPTLPKNTPLIARVVAKSADGALSGVASTDVQLR